LTPPAPDLAASHRLGSIGIVSLTNSAKSKIDLLPKKHIQLLRCGPITRATVPALRPEDPAIRWSVSSDGDHGSGARLIGGGHTKTARGPASEPSETAPGRFGRPGVHPVSSIQ